ncbi:biopolymer transport protein ExbB2 [Actinobacillus equuli]|nr:biopolymer transport protein ExbB2 [Actinobacillus equuli]
MEQMLELLQGHVDYIILGLLLLMSVVLVWKIVERVLFINSLMSPNMKPSKI